MLTAALFAAAVLVTAALSVLTERAVLGFRRLRPTFCSIYDPYFWRIERLWKFNEDAYLKIFDGTPFKNLIWRALGVRIGRRVFDDGCSMPDRTLVALGDDCVLNAGSTIQCHSQEDGTYKSDRTALGAGLHRRRRRPGPLRRDDRRGGGTGRRLLPDEGRGGPSRRTLGREPGQGDVR